MAALTKLWQVRKAVVVHLCLHSVCPSKHGGRLAIPHHVQPSPSSPALAGPDLDLPTMSAQELLTLCCCSKDLLGRTPL